MSWKVIPTKTAAKQLDKIPKKLGIIYRQLVEDLAQEGPYPFGWDCKPLKGSKEIRIRLNREWRVIIEVIAPTIIVVRVAHRSEVYR